MRLIINHANCFDTDALTFTGETTLVAEDGVIVSVGEGAAAGDGDVVVDAGGAFMLPGFIDAHVHHRLTTLDFRRLAGWSEVEFGLAMGKIAAANLHRGFTPVRDLGGDVEGLIRAIRTGRNSASPITPMAARPTCVC